MSPADGVQESGASDVSHAAEPSGRYAIFSVPPKSENVSVSGRRDIRSRLTELSSSVP